MVLEAVRDSVSLQLGTEGLGWETPCLNLRRTLPFEGSCPENLVALLFQTSMATYLKLSLFKKQAKLSVFWNRAYNMLCLIKNDLFTEAI